MLKSLVAAALPAVAPMRAPVSPAAEPRSALIHTILPGEEAVDGFAAAALPALPAAAASPQAAAMSPAATPREAPGPGSKSAPSPEAQTAAGMSRFGGSGARAPDGDDSGWTFHRFRSAAGGAEIAYKRREGSPAEPARVYAGGLGLNESFDALLETSRGPGHEYFVWTRGHAPSGWAPTRSPLDADARDLARVIVEAARATPHGRVELALHSFGTLVFQRLVQLRGEPEARAALRALRGGRVFLVNGVTHYPGSTRQAQPGTGQLAASSIAFKDWLDAGDDAAAAWQAAARLNPLLLPAAQALAAAWSAQRASAIALASANAAASLKAELEKPWPAELEPLRRRFLARRAKDERDPAWQEALLRRTADLFELSMTAEDVRAIRRAGVRLELVHAVDEQLINWGSARALMALFGIPAPESVPAPGSVLTDGSGLFRARIVAGDHYFPLLRSGELARLLAGPAAPTARSSRRRR